MMRALTFYYTLDIRSVDPQTWIEMQGADCTAQQQQQYWAYYPSLDELNLQWHVPVSNHKRVIVTLLV